MKFTQAFNLLALAIAAKSAVIPTSSESESEIENTQCQDSFELMKKCILLDEKNLGVSACEIFESTACQHLYENIDDELKLCENSEVQFSSEYVKDFIKKYTNVCVKDENGEYCPLASIVTAENFDGFVLDSNKSESEILADVYSLNCVSEKCRLAAIDFIQGNRDALKEQNSKLDYNDDELVGSINDLGRLITHLQTVQCREHKASTNTNENAISVLNDEINESDEENVDVPVEDTTVQAVDEESSDDETTSTVSAEDSTTILIEETTTVPVEETTTVTVEETTTVLTEDTITATVEETSTVLAEETSTVNVEIPTENGGESSDEDEQTVNAEIPTENGDDSSDEETTFVPVEQTVYSPNVNSTIEVSKESTEATTAPVESSTFIPKNEQSDEENTVSVEAEVPTEGNDSDEENTASVEAEVPTQGNDSDVESDGEDKLPVFVNVKQIQQQNNQPTIKEIPQPIDLEQFIQPETNPVVKYIKEKAAEKPVSKPKRKCFVKVPKH